MAGTVGVRGGPGRSSGGISSGDFVRTSDGQLSGLLSFGTIGNCGEPPVGVDGTCCTFLGARDIGARFVNDSDGLDSRLISSYFRSSVRHRGCVFFLIIGVYLRRNFLFLSVTLPEPSTPTTY